MSTVSKLIRSTNNWAHTVDHGIELQAIHGTQAAARHFRSHSIPLSMALRVLGRTDRRRGRVLSDIARVAPAPHQAMPLSRPAEERVLAATVFLDIL